MSDLVGEVLEVCYERAKNYSLSLEENINKPLTIGKTFAVVFDFDGTLTLGKYNKTTWESLWTELGYDIRVCQELHQKYDRKEISHPQWCILTQEKFISKNLKRELVEKIAKQIKLISGIEETFQELKKKDIKIYIVSGSIGTVIDTVLGDLTKYIEIIKANQF